MLGFGTFFNRLASEDIRLTLVDLGASIEPHPGFVPLLPYSIYIGFDPDDRALPADKSRKFYRRLMVPRAIVPDPDRDVATLYLTRNPTCSSTLRPNDGVLSNYLFRDRFSVVEKTVTPSTTVDAALDEQDIDRIDWIKLDTQGTDLRLWSSISARRRSNIMAVDLEPGFDAFYEGEDQFPVVHNQLVSEGFWLADLAVTSAARIRPESAARLLRCSSPAMRALLEITLKQSPVAAGPRYLRSIESVNASEAEPSDYLRLWMCSTASLNHPFALDVLCSLVDRHGESDTIRALIQFSRRRASLQALRNLPRLLTRLRVDNIRRLMRSEF